MLKDLLIAAILSVLQPGGADITIGPEVTERGWSITARHAQPDSDPYGNALRYYMESNYLTARCTINIAPRPMYMNGWRKTHDIRLFVVAHEFAHCFDEYPVPPGVDPSDWRETFADIGAVILTIAISGNDYADLLRIRPHLRGRSEGILSTVKSLGLEGAGADRVAIEACIIRNRFFGVGVDCHAASKSQRH